MSLDVESGQSSIYPISQERISFIRKVYSILTFQLLLTIAVVSIVVFVSPIANSFKNTNYKEDRAFDLIALIAFCLICYYHEKHHLCYFFLLILTISMSLSVGSTCAIVDRALANGKLIILEVVILTIVVVISLSLYTFWATKRGHDFIFLGPFLWGAVLVLILFGLIQIIFFPIGKLSAMIYLCMGSIIMYGLIVYYTHNLIKWFSYAGFIWGSTLLYLFVIDVFLSLLLIFGIAELIKKNKI